MASVTSKLRDSCNACAVSKIKCPKEKPRCSRCESRGVDCHYSLTRRPGRRPEGGENRDRDGPRRRLSSLSASSNLASTLEAITVAKAKGNLDSIAGIVSDHGPKPRPQLSSRSTVGAASGSNSTSNNTSSSTGSSDAGPDLHLAQMGHDILDKLFWSESSSAPATISQPAGIALTPGNTPALDEGASASSYFDLPIPSATTQSSIVSTPALNDTGLPISGLMDCTDDPSIFGDGLDMQDFADFDGFDHMEDLIDPALDFVPPLHEGSASPTNFTPKAVDIASLLMSSTNGSTTDGHAGASGDAMHLDSLSPSLFAWPDPTFGPSSAPTLSPPSTAMSSSPSQVAQLPAFFTPSSVSHLAQSLEILKNLSSAESGKPSAAGSSGMDDAASADKFTKLVLGENQQSIDAVGAILSSPSCGSDSFLLAILSMTVLKILERYDVAAKAGDDCMSWPDSGFSSHLRDNHMQAVATPHPGGGHGHSVNVPRRRGNNGERVTAAAKLVLRELHRVQRLVNEVSRESQKHRESGANGIDRDLMGLSAGLESSSSSSFEWPRPLVNTTTLAQLEMDMRKKLNALSTGIIDRLRNG